MERPERIDTLKTFTLKDGTEESSPLVAVMKLTLERILQEHPLAVWDLRTMCDDREYKPFGPNGDILRGNSLLGLDGKMHDSTRNIVRNMVKIDGFNISLVDPVKRDDQ